MSHRPAIEMEMQLLEWTWVHSDKLHTILFVWLIGSGWIFFGGFDIKGGAYYSSTRCNNMNHQLSSQDIIIAQCWSQRRLQRGITISINIRDHYERPVWMAAEICDNNFAIGSFYRSDDITTMQSISSGSFVFVERKFICINQLRKTHSMCFYGEWCQFWVS